MMEHCQFSRNYDHGWRLNKPTLMGLDHPQKSYLFIREEF